MKPISLPLPPSVNVAYANNKKGSGRGRYKTAVYTAWAEEAGWELIIQKPPKIYGNFSANIILDENKRGQSDIDNRVKCLFDILEKHEVIENDRMCDSFSIEWGEAPKGCIVTLKEIEHI